MCVCLLFIKLVFYCTLRPFDSRLASFIFFSIIYVFYYSGVLDQSLFFLYNHTPDIECLWLTPINSPTD